LKVQLKIYLSGPMTGLPDLNYPAFKAAAAALRAMGHEVYNPQEWEDSNNFGKFNHLLAFDDYCRYIVREADVVVMLPGWEDSPGATAESSVARAVRKPSRPFEEFISISDKDMFDYLTFDASKGLDQMI
jgi:nucleoside 2-deoxyribosyltransferase